MKRFLLLLAIASVATGGYAQLKVTQTGQVCIGDKSTSQSISKLPIAIGPTVNPDTTASVRVFGTGSYKSAGKIAFGNLGHVSIGESTYNSFSTNMSTLLELAGKGGISYLSGNSTIFKYDTALAGTSGTGSPFVFNVSLNAPQFLTSSDSRLKTDIEPLEDVGSMLKGITPVSYLLKRQSPDGDDSNYKSRANTSSLQRVSDVTSNQGLQIHSEGVLTIECEGKIDLKNDIIYEGGCLTLKGESLELGSGFSIETGAEFSFAVEEYQ